MRSENVTEKERCYEARRVTHVSFIANAILTAIKIFAGIFGFSAAMLADGIHSLSDFFTDIVVLIGIGFSGKPADDQHNYGHEKYETLATVVIGIALFLAGYKILSSGAVSIYEVLVGGKTIERPAAIAVLAAILSILSKEFLYRYTKAVGEKINSPSVIANGWHHRSDALSSVGTLIGIGGAFILGDKWTILDPVASVIVSMFIFKVAFEVLLPALNELVESSLSTEDNDYIKSVIEKSPQIQGYHKLRTRRIGSKVAIDVHFNFEKTLSVYDAHEYATDIENQLKLYFGDSSIIITHLEPSA